MSKQSPGAASSGEKPAQPDTKDFAQGGPGFGVAAQPVWIRVLSGDVDGDCWAAIVGEPGNALSHEVELGAVFTGIEVGAAPDFDGCTWMYWLAVRAQAHSHEVIVH